MAAVTESSCFSSSHLSKQMFLSFTSAHFLFFTFQCMYVIFCRICLLLSMWKALPARKSGWVILEQCSWEPIVLSSFPVFSFFLALWNYVYVLEIRDVSVEFVPPRLGWHNIEPQYLTPTLCLCTVNVVRMIHFWGDTLSASIVTSL